MDLRKCKVSLFEESKEEQEYYQNVIEDEISDYLRRLEMEQAQLKTDVSKRYFHELSQEEVDKLIADKKNWGDIVREYKQPEWCNYPNALEGTMGCWSLVDLSKDGLRTKISKEFCKGCDECSL